MDILNKKKMNNWIKHIWRYLTSPTYRAYDDLAKRQAHLDRVKDLMLRQQHYNLAKMLDPKFPELERIEKFEESMGRRIF